MTTVAIVGCTHAGTFAATSILREHPDWSVHVFERGDTLSFLSCGIALWVGDHVSDPRKMFYSSPAELEKLGATMHMRTDVTDIDVAGKTLEFRSLETGDSQTLQFDKLVVTTGSRPCARPRGGDGHQAGVLSAHARVLVAMIGFRTAPRRLFALRLESVAAQVERGLFVLT